VIEVWGSLNRACRMTGHPEEAEQRRLKDLPHCEIAGGPTSRRGKLLNEKPYTR
jgi:hypothetical protein